MFRRVFTCKFTRISHNSKMLFITGINPIIQCNTKNVKPDLYTSSMQCSYIGRRFYSIDNKSQDLITVDYDYVKNAVNNKQILIVDVREPEELKEHGHIPSSINIPLGSVPAVFDKMPETEFQQAYNRIKPTKKTEIIFYCMIGKRSGLAQQSAVDLGYKNAKNYLGSWTDWANKIQ